MSRTETIRTLASEAHSRVKPSRNSLAPTTVSVAPNQASNASSTATLDIETGLIDANPFQPRRQFNPSEIESLAALHKVDGGRPRSYRVPMPALLLPAAFCSANLIIYWGGFETTWKLACAMAIGLILFAVGAWRSGTGAQHTIRNAFWTAQARSCDTLNLPRFPRRSVPQSSHCSSKPSKSASVVRVTPNPSIEGTFQRPLRVLGSAPHVKRLSTQSDRVTFRAILGPWTQKLSHISRESSLLSTTVATRLPF